MTGLQNFARCVNPKTKTQRLAYKSIKAELNQF